MRRQNRLYASTPAPALAVENMSIDQILQGRAVLSIEEEVIALQEADALADSVSKDVAETTRVEDVTDTMLNIADTISDVKEITPEQAMLIDTASEMAVAGSDGDPDDVIPSAEVLLDPNSGVTVESFVEDIRKRANEIWQRIKAFCLQIWNSITEFFQRLFAAAPRLLHRVKQLRDAISVTKTSSKESSPKSAVVSVMVGSNAISYPDYMVRDTKELIKGIGELKTLSTYAYGPYLRDCKSMAEQVAGALKKFDAKKPAEALEMVAVGLQKNNFNQLPTNPPTGYLGCFDIHPTRLDLKKTKELSHAQIVSALRNTGVKLQARHGHSPMLNTKNGFQTMSFVEMESTLKAVEELVKQLVTYETSSASKDVEKVRAALIDGGNHASQALSTLTSTDAASQTERAFAMDVMKGLANFNTTLTRWISELTMPMSKKIYQTSRASLVLVENSLRQYA